MAKGDRAAWTPKSSFTVPSGPESLRVAGELAADDVTTGLASTVVCHPVGPVHKGHRRRANDCHATERKHKSGPSRVLPTLAGKMPDHDRDLAVEIDGHRPPGGGVVAGDGHRPRRRAPGSGSRSRSEQSEDHCDHADEHCGPARRVGKVGHLDRSLAQRHEVT